MPWKFPMNISLKSAQFCMQPGLRLSNYACTKSNKYKGEIAGYKVTMLRSSRMTRQLVVSQPKVGV
jgi:hypothetical protein